MRLWDKLWDSAVDYIIGAEIVVIGATSATTGYIGLERLIESANLRAVIAQANHLLSNY